MPKYLLLKHYRGGPEPHHPFPPMDQWAPEDVEAHMAFQRHVSALLEENGEYVDAQALTPARTWVRYGGQDAAPVTTDGPHPETSDLIAGWFMIDVESPERALEVAAYVSSEPGPGGEPLYEWIDVREIMSGTPSELIRRDRRDAGTAGRGRAARPRPAGARRPAPPGRGLRCRRGRAPGGAAGGAPGLARSPAARPARVADHGRDAAARRRPPQRGRPAAPRGDEYAEPRPAVTEEGDDTLFLLFCCCHPDLAPASQVALTLRAVGGLTTREIADAFYVPEATMAQRISRAKRTVRGRRLDQPGDLAVVLRVLYLVYTAGHAGRVDLAGEAIRLARQLTLATQEPEARGLLALMLLNHARMPGAARPRGPDRHARPAGPRPLGHERDRRGRARPAVGARRADRRAAPGPLPDRGRHRRPARRRGERRGDRLAADPRLVRRPRRADRRPRAPDPAAVLGRAVAVGHVHGASAGLRETDRLREVIGDRHRWHAVRGHLHEFGGDLPAAAGAYAEAARRATNVAERDHLVRQAAWARAADHAKAEGAPP